VEKLSTGMTRMEVESVMGNARAGAGLPEVVDLRARDEEITDDELTPVVFRDGKVAGIGYPFPGAPVPKYRGLQ
jgi:hypothetical protein